MAITTSTGLLGLVSAALLITMACSPAAPAPPTSAPSATAVPKPAQPAPGSTAAATSADWNAVVDAAKKEGEVIVWGNSGTERKAFWKDAFEKAYPGITVSLFQADTNNARDARYLQERQAGIAKVDILVSGSAGVNSSLKPQGAVQPVLPLLRDDVLGKNNWKQGLLWVDNEQQYLFQSDVQSIPTVILNSSVDPNDVQSWDDLLKEQFRGKIVMLDPRTSGNGFAAMLWVHQNPDLGEAYMTRFFDKRIVFSPDERQNVEWVDSGRMLIGLAAQPTEIGNILSVGSKINVVRTLKVNGSPQGFYLGAEGILALPKLDALPHPNAARVYMNWFYGHDGQQAMVDNVSHPSNRADVDQSKLPSYVLPDPAAQYTNVNNERYTGAEPVKAMRAVVDKVYQAP